MLKLTGFILGVMLAVGLSLALMPSKLCAALIGAACGGLGTMLGAIHDEQFRR